MQFGFHVEQLLGFGLRELDDRNARGGRHHFGDHVLVHNHLGVGFALMPSLLPVFKLSLQLFQVVAHVGGLLEVLVLNGLFLFGAQLGHLGFKLLQLRRHGQTLDTQACTGLVDQVDGLIGQAAILNVAGRKFRGSLDGAISDGHAMVVLVTFAQALQNLNGFGDGRLVHLDRLETTFQRGILFDVLAVFVGGGGANGLKFATSQHRLKHVGRAQRAIGGTRAHNRMNLVDEQHDVAARLDLLEHLLQAFLKVATVTRTSHHGTQVKRIHLLAFQGFRHVARVDLLRQAFDHSGLAHARLADQHRIVLGAAAQHDHHTLDLLRAADHRVQLACGGFGGKVTTELVENGGTGLVGLVCHATGVRQFALVVAARIAADHVDGGRTQFAQIHFHLDEHLRADAFTFANQAEQNMFRADVAVAELQGFTQAEFQHLLGVRSERNVAVGRGVALADHFDDLLAGGLKLHALGSERLGGHAFTFANQAEQQVFGADVVVLKGPCLFLRQHNHAPCTVCKPFEHACPSSSYTAPHFTDSQ